MSAPRYGRLPRMIAAAARAEGLSSAAVLRDNRARPLVQVRRAVAHVARDAGYSLCMIGRALNRDHTTVLHHVRWAAEHAADPDFAELCAIVRAVQ
jgi:chromosomal replication initiation ATPase DnaA